jgi:general secretion pathway protein J
MIRQEMRLQESGSTLLELLVAVALLALLCSYSFTAIRNLRNFDRVARNIEDLSSVDSIAAHIRRTIAGTRMAFFTHAGSTAGLAFIGEESRIALVTDGESRLELGGHYLVQMNLINEHQFVAFRRPFRSNMPPLTNEAPIVLLDGVAALSFRYYGSPEEGAEPEWQARWASSHVLPKAVKVSAITDGQRALVSLLIPLESAF